MANGTINLMAASNLWASMPPEARFWNLADLHAEAQRQRQAAGKVIEMAFN
jgi:hypothetical protein